MTEPELQLGISKDVLIMYKRQQLTETLADMISQSRRTVRIFSDNLEPRIYSHEAICQPLASMVSQSRRAKVEILIQDIEAVIKADHAMVKLMRHLSSYVEIRITAQEHSQYDQAFALIDDCGYYHRRPQDSRDFEVCYNGRLKVRDLANEFKAMWEQSRRATKLLQLHI